MRDVSSWPRLIVRVLSLAVVVAVVVSAAGLALSPAFAPFAAVVLGGATLLACVFVFLRRFSRPTMAVPDAFSRETLSTDRAPARNDDADAPWRTAVTVSA